MSKWISVADRLPPKGLRVRVKNAKGKSRTAHYGKENFSHDKDCWRGKYGNPIGVQTHWSYLNTAEGA